MARNHGPWPPWEAVSLKSSLDTLASTVRTPPNTRNDDEQVWLTRFLVIRTCGYLEQVVAEVARAYVREKSGGLVRSFATSWLVRSRNPTPENLIELVGRFDGQLSSDLEEFLRMDDSYLYRELSFLVDRRNKIAHGLNESLNSRKALGLMSDATLVADWFIENLKPH